MVITEMNEFVHGACSQNMLTLPGSTVRTRTCDIVHHMLADFVHRIFFDQWVETMGARCEQVAGALPGTWGSRVPRQRKGAEDGRHKKRRVISLTDLMPAV